MKRRLCVLCCLVALSTPLPVADAIPHLFHPTLARIGANQSGNWFGYDAGSVERGVLFTQISGRWHVPAARQHKRRQHEYSSAWIGIGGGCMDTSCTTSDGTLIQAGSESDVTASGRPVYSAWWELIPQTSVRIHRPVSAGDLMIVDIRQLASAATDWQIKVRDATKGWTFKQTVQYSSTQGSAEWITETPLIIGGSGSGFAALPRLTNVRFDAGRLNQAPPGLVGSEKIELVDANNHVIGEPSAPDAESDGFADCAWTNTCPAPN